MVVLFDDGIIWVIVSGVLVDEWCRWFGVKLVLVVIVG